MEKVVLEKSFSDCLNKSFNTYEGYFNYEYLVFHDLERLVFQNAKCLLLELHVASVTLTNHILERLLKLALINKATGIKGIEAEKLNEVFAKTHEKYNSLKMGNSIEQCHKENLVNDKEKELLFKVIREQIRNGFSHADMEKVLVNSPDSMRAVEGKFSDPGAIKHFALNPKLIPTMQALYVEKFAEVNAAPYFEAVFNLMINIEKRIVERNKQS